MLDPYDRRVRMSARRGEECNRRVSGKDAQDDNQDRLRCLTVFVIEINTRVNKNNQLLFGICHGI